MPDKQEQEQHTDQDNGALEDSSSTHSWQPELVYIPPGEFWMGCHKRDPYVRKYEWPFHRVYLPGYWIGRYPVTNAQYHHFLLANPEVLAPRFWKERNFSPGRADHPVNTVGWRDALAYCAWLSEVTGKPYTLPSEAEWEKAARGTDGRRYTWGNGWRGNLAYTHEEYEKRRDSDMTTKVGTYSPHGDSPYGCADMVSNVLEWTRSLFAPYPYRPDDGREDLGAEGERAQRGAGCLFVDRGDYRCAGRARANAEALDWFQMPGFRVAIAAQPATVDEILRMRQPWPIRRTRHLPR